MQPPLNPNQQRPSSPHRSHSDPWAMDYICCDQLHAASSSSTQNASIPRGSYSSDMSTLSSPIDMMTQHDHSSAFASSLANSRPTSQGGRTCPSGEGCCAETACGPGECCTDPLCDKLDLGGGQSQNQRKVLEQAGVKVGDADQGEELFKWACSKEGCAAIQHYLETCTQPDCRLPTVPPPRTNVELTHPPSNTHYHLSNPIDEMIASLGPFHSALHSQNGHVHQPSPSSGMFSGISPSNFQNSSFPNHGSHYHLNQYQLNNGHLNGHSHQHSHSHGIQQRSHQQLHDHSHHHTHTHMPNHNARHAHSGPSFQHPHPPSHSHHHSHSHSTSISSMTPQSTMTSPDLLPWSNPSSVPTPMSTGSHSTPAPMVFPIHVCHWQNCHLTFSSMPDLLGHVAADHLGAAGFGPSNPLPPQTPNLSTSFSQPHQNLQSLPNPFTFPGSSHSGLNSSTSTPGSSVPSLSALGISHQSPAQAQAEQDRLLSCLWDDCFPLPNECSAEQPDQCPPHTHIPAPSDCTVSHPHSHTHTHLHAGEEGLPFSPQTMLRHVLEEHLGVPGDILGWEHDAEFGLESLAAGLAGGPMGAGGKGENKRSHDQLSGKESRSGSGESVLESITTGDSSRQSSPSKLSIVCLWHGCKHLEPFSTPSELTDHVAEYHVGRGKDAYVCLWGECANAGSEGAEIEGRAFRSRQKVLRHLQSHTGHKPFVCDICDQAFSEAAPLAAHMRRHNEEKPFICEVEGCGKRFAISSSLTIHMRTHNGDKPFVCPHCSKGFVEASNLTKHIRTHTGEKPFPCPHPGCDKRFPRPDQLKRHMGVHEKVKGKGGKAKAKGKAEVG